MKPYGREKKIKGLCRWKRDYHLHENGRKVKNWWEVIAGFLTRSSIKQRLNDEIRAEAFSRYCEMTECACFNPKCDIFCQRAINQMIQ